MEFGVVLQPNPPASGVVAMMKRAEAAGVMLADGRGVEPIDDECAAGPARRTWSSPRRDSSPDAGNSMWGAGNLQTDAPVEGRNAGSVI